MSLQSPGPNSIHKSSIESACRSPTRLTEASASRSAVLRESARKLAVCMGSNGGPVRASSTSTKSQVGRVEGRGGFSLLAPSKKSYDQVISADRAIFDVRVKGCYSSHIHFQCGWHTTTIKSLLKEDKDYWYWAADWVFTPRYAPT